MLCQPLYKGVSCVTWLIFRPLRSLLIVCKQLSTVSSHSGWWHFRSTIIDNVNRLHYVGGRTSASAALRLLTSSLFTVQEGARASVPHVAVVVTDGSLDDMPQAKAEVCAVSLQLSIHYYTPVPVGKEAIRVTFVRPSVRPTVCPSVAYIANNSWTQRPSMPKFGRKVPHLWCDLHTSFKIKRSKVKVTTPINEHLYSPDIW